MPCQNCLRPRHYLRRHGAGDSLQTTGLINEAFVRLIGKEPIGWESRAHFFGIAARTMRDIVVEQARRTLAKKRGGGERDLPFDEAAFIVNDRDEAQLIALDDALTALTEIDPELGRLVELRFFTGLTVEEAARVLEVSPRTVKRSWRTAKLWLQRELEGRSDDPTGP